MDNSFIVSMIVFLIGFQSVVIVGLLLQMWRVNIKIMDLLTQLSEWLKVDLPTNHK